MRIATKAALSLALAAVCACGDQPEPPAPAPTTQAAPALWFLCDGIDAPRIVTAFRDGAQVDLRVVDKTSGSEILSQTLAIGSAEGAAGSIYTALLRDGADAGVVREINAGMLETPGAAYTRPVTSVEIDGERITCRWMARTRAAGFTDRRSFVVNEDADGDLIYTAFDFAAPGAATPIELTENQRSTTFSVEARGGEEQLGGDGATFRFPRADVVYGVSLPRSGEAQLTISRGGETVQTEPIRAVLLGQAE